MFSSSAAASISNTTAAFNNYGTELERVGTNTGQVTSRSSSMLHTLATTVGQFYILYMAVKKVANVFAEWYTASNDYIENLNLFTVTMRDSTDAAYSYAESVEKIVGINISEWISYQGEFQQLTKGFGVSSEQADIMSQSLTQLSYDLSSFFNVDVETASDKLNSAMAGQVKGLREYGIDVSNASLQSYALSKGIDQSVTSMSQAEKSLLRYNYIMEKTVDIQGDMTRTLVTPANALRVLSTQVDKLKRALGDIISTLVTQFIPYVQAAVTLITELANKIANFFGFELPTIDYSSLDDATSATEDLDDAASSVADDFSDAVDEVKELKKQLMGFDELNILKSSTTSSSGSSKSDTSDATKTVSNLGLGVESYDFGLDGVENQAEKILENIKSIFNNLYENSGAKNFFDSINKATKNIDYGYIHDNISEIAKDINDINIDISPSVVNFNKSLGEMLGSVAGFALTVSGKITEYTTGGIRNWLSQDKEYISSTLSDILRNFSSGFGNLTPIFKDATERAAKFFDAIRPLTEATISTPLSILTRIFGTMGLTTSKAFELMTSAINSFYFYTVETVFPEVVNVIKNFISTAYSSVKWVVEQFASLFGQSWTLAELPDWLISSSAHGTSGAFSDNYANSEEYYKYLYRHSNAQYASGGFPETGEYFLARESGPEMVGRIGSQNAVVNNDQIVTAISQAVYNAIISAGSVRSGESQKVGIEAEDVTLSGDIIFRSFVRAHNDYVYANGSSPLDI